MLLFRRRRKKGFVLLSVLMALMIIAILTQTYMGARGPDGKTFAQRQQDRASAAVTAMNLRSAQTEFFMKTEGRRLPPDQMRQQLAQLSRRMGNGGRFYVDQNMNLHVTTMMDTPMFRDQYGELPRIR